MGLTGLEIFKQLPKTNCKECGQPTCLAFAMQLAAGKASLDACPHVSDEAKENLESASAPPVALVKIGAGEKELQIGNETVLFRHEKRFEHPCGIAIAVSDQEDVSAKVAQINKLVFDRVGQTHEINLVAVVNDSGNADTFAEAVKIAQADTKYPLILISEDVGAIEKALALAAAQKPLVYGATADNIDAMIELAKKNEVPLAVKAKNLDELAELSKKVTSAGCKNIVLDSGARDVNEILFDQTQMRRSALKRFRAFGFPTITFIDNDDPIQAVVDASVAIAKYSGIVVLKTADPADILPLITLRLNIYTDPQKPIAVESKIYEIGSPDDKSPIFITTNFSLTYFCVEGDVDAGRISSYILPVDTDGVSVLTAWAAGKFTPEKIADAVKKSGLGDKVAHKKLIIPGGVAVLSGELQEVSGWDVLVGPRESSGIPSFIKQKWSA